MQRLSYILTDRLTSIGHTFQKFSYEVKHVQANNVFAIDGVTRILSTYSFDQDVHCNKGHFALHICSTRLEPLQLSACKHGYLAVGEPCANRLVDVNYIGNSVPAIFICLCLQILCYLKRPILCRAHESVLPMCINPCSKLPDFETCLQQV